MGGDLIGFWTPFRSYIRVQSVLVFLLTLIAFYLYPANMLLYGGFFFAISIYLMLAGGGKFTLFQSEIPTEQNQYWAKFILQVLTGAAFVISGVYKLIYPNLDIELLSINHSFTFFIPYEIFTLLMALVEITSGVAIILGIFLRTVSFISFFYLSYILNENIFAHLFVYGILLSFLLNGSYSKPDSKK